MTLDDTPYTVPVPGDKVGGRLDRMLAEAVPELSRTRLKALIEAGRVTRMGSDAPTTDPAHKVAAGEAYLVLVPPVLPARPEPQAIPLKVLFEDRHLIVLHKPAGLVVHPAPGQPDHTLVNALLAHCANELSGIGGVGRPGIVHRLDKDTSGVMVVAKTDTAHQGLARQFALHTLERAYQALVWGVPTPTEGEIHGNIGRSPFDRKKMAVVSRGGKPALTRYRVLRVVAHGVASLVECRLATGRTHQIRVHMASRGHPVVGDPLYGGRGPRRLPASLPAAAKEALTAFPRQALHAYLIGFTHPVTGETQRFEQNISNDISELIEILDVF